MAERHPKEATGTRETHPVFSRDKFESTPEFANFASGMRRLLKVPKSEVDEAVRIAKIESPRRDNPLAPGRKKKDGPSS